MTTMTDLRGKTILITGASSGIGLEASAVLAGRGAAVVMVGRSRAKLDDAAVQVRARSQAAAGAAAGSVGTRLCDFASQDSIRALAAEVRQTLPRIDVLVNNAGGVSATRKLVAGGFEETFAVNHLGYFLFTNLLLEQLVRGAPARIVNVASAAHRMATLDFDDLHFEKDYSVMRAYARSKLCNVLFTAELARRLSGTGVTANSLHPGAVATHIWSNAPWYTLPMLAVAKLFMLSPARGAQTIVHLAASPELEGKSGGYYEKNALVRPSRLACDEALARGLWDLSAKMTGLAGAGA